MDVEIFLSLSKALEIRTYLWSTMFLSAHVTICIKYSRRDVFLSYRCSKKYKDGVDLPKLLFTASEG